jgi:hypothetical protein
MKSRPRPHGPAHRRNGLGVDGYAAECAGSSEPVTEVSRKPARKNPGESKHGVARTDTLGSVTWTVSI